jgi:glycopeptide antibiotics resistance protein
MIYGLPIAVFAALLPFVLPVVCGRLGLQVHQTAKWPAFLAAFLSLAAFLIPDVHISSQTTTFQLHFVGGGMYCALLFVYLKRFFGLRINIWVSLLLLFALTSTFGVANELVEFTLNHLGVASVDISDTSWDLLANTSGALFGYVLYVVATKAVVVFARKDTRGRWGRNN